MGHIHLGVLPRTRLWRDVVGLLREEAADGSIVSASALAAEKDLLSATQDPVYIEAVRLLLAVPLAARADSFGQALRDSGIAVAGEPGLLDLTSSLSVRLDAVGLLSGNRTDLGELAARALVSTLSLAIGDALPGLFGATPEDVKVEAKRLSWSRGISQLSRMFFADLVSRSLSSWLDRTLAHHVGEKRKFVDVGARGEFDLSVAHYSLEATRVIEEFAGGWYGKTIHRQGSITTHDATVFGAVSLRKIVEELRVRRDPDA